MKILITGGTGFIGSSLVEELSLSGYELIVLSRDKHENKNGISFIQWESESLKEAVSKADIVINLAGEPIANKRWTGEQKKLIYDSRVAATRLLVRAINSSANKPKKLISASAIGFYGNRYDEIVTESSSCGVGFLADTCKDWEEEANKAETNVLILRTGLVLGSGGALKKMLMPFKMFIGGPLGPGSQYMSWIHLHDMIQLIKFLVENKDVTGIINATSPNPVTNKEFSNVLGSILTRPSFMTAPAFALKLLLGEMASLLLEGQKVLPERALQYGYKFKYSELEGALRSLFA